MHLRPEHSRKTNQTFVSSSNLHLQRRAQTQLFLWNCFYWCSWQINTSNQKIVKTQTHRVYYMSIRLPTV